MVFRVLRYIRSVAVSSSLLPSPFPVSFRISSRVCVGSLTSWPLSFVPFCDLASLWPLAHRFLWTGFRYEIRFSLGAFSRLFRALSLLGFTLALSRLSLLTFWLPLRSLASGAPLDHKVCLSRLRSFDCPGVSLHRWSCSPSVLPEWRSLFGVSSFHLSSNSNSISVTAYLCSPKGLWTVTSSALASIKTDARLYALLRFEV